jgi:chromosome segregation ATPase
MTSTERDLLETLKRDVQRAFEDIGALREQDIHTTGLIDTMRQRLEALEKRFSAMEARMTHIDTMLMELQGEVRRMNRSLEALSRDQSSALTELRGMMGRVLDLLQPKVTVGEPPVAGG